MYNAVPPGERNFLAFNGVIKADNCKDRSLPGATPAHQQWGEVS